MQKHELIRDARVKVLKVLEKKIEEAEDTARDILDDVAAELGYVDADDVLKSDGNYEAYLALEQEIIEQAYRQLAGQLLKEGVWAMVALSPEAGMEVELFSERPHTKNHPSNWPKWYRLFEGNLDGGDSICIDSRGELI